MTDASQPAIEAIAPPRGRRRLPVVETIWVTDTELIRRSGVPERTMRRLLRQLDANPLSGFPKKQKLWGDRRHWPSVLEYWAKITSPNMRRA